MNKIDANNNMFMPYESIFFSLHAHLFWFFLEYIPAEYCSVIGRQMEN